jgi:hypothetical protein
MAKTKDESVDIEAIEKYINQKINLTLCDRETEERRSFTLEEAKTWDWRNPETWRMIGDWQISSYNSLLHVITLKIESGHKEVEIIEAPRFAMLAGG